MSSAVFYPTSEYEEPESSSVIPYTTDTPPKSPADQSITGKPGLVPKRAIPLPRGACIPTQSPSSPQTKVEPPKPPVSSRRPSEVSGSRTTLTDDVKFMTLPSKGSPLWTASDDTSLGRNKENGSQSKPHVPTKPSSVQSYSSDVAKPASAASFSSKPTIPDKPSCPASGKPFIPLKPAQIVSGKPLSSTPNTKKPVDRSSGEHGSGLESTQRRSPSVSLSSSSDSLTTIGGNKDKDVPSGLPDGKQGVQSRPIPPPRVKRRIGSAGLEVNGHEDTHTVINEDRQEEVSVSNCIWTLLIHIKFLYYSAFLFNQLLCPYCMSAALVQIVKCQGMLLGNCVKDLQFP